MKNLFRQQIENGNPITEELLTELPQKNYSSGEEKQINDIPLWGFKVEFNGSEGKETLSLTLFSLCEREFPYYQEQYTVIPNPLSSGSYGIPIFIPKGMENKYESIKNDHLKNV